MTRIYILQGLPASGKSTWTEQFLLEHPGETCTVLSYDMYRKQLPYCNIEKVHERETAIKAKLRGDILVNAWEDVDHIILDNTNLSDKSNKVITDFIERTVRTSKGAEVEVQLVSHFLDVPVLECIRRDMKREESKRVGPEVIFNLDKNAARLRSQRQKELVWHARRRYERMEEIGASDGGAIIDIDGTVALIPPGGRGAYTGSRVMEDVLNFPVRDIIRNWVIGQNYFDIVPHLWFFSGRENETLSGDSSVYALTEQWLKNNVIETIQPHTFTWSLTMRAEGDHRSDDIVKKEMFYNLSEKEQEQIGIVFDDRDRVVKMWRSLGLTCFQVAPGDF